MLIATTVLRTSRLRRERTKLKRARVLLKTRIDITIHVLDLHTTSSNQDAEAGHCQRQDLGIV
jgi:hypothetical protein